MDLLAQDQSLRSYAIAYATRGYPMTTHYLHGNHDPCAACELRRELQDTTPAIRDPIPCNVCGGTGQLPLSDAEIVRRTVAEARRIYWPEFDRRVSHG